MIQITLEAARVNARLSLAEAAEALGLKDPDTLRSWEKGKTFPNAVQIKAIEKLYSVPYDSINFLPKNSV